MLVFVLKKLVEKELRVYCSLYYHHICVVMTCLVTVRNTKGAFQNDTVCTKFGFKATKHLVTLLKKVVSLYQSEASPIPVHKACCKEHLQFLVDNRR